MFVLQDPWSNKTLNLGHFGPRFLSLFKSFLKTYWQTTYFPERLKSLQVLLALLGLRQQDTVVSVKPGMSFSPFFYKTKLRIFRLTSIM